MPSVVLVSSTGLEFTVSTPYRFVTAVYSDGAMPKTGTIAENYEILTEGGPEPVDSANDHVTLGDLQTLTSPALEALLGLLEERISREGAVAGQVPILQAGGDLSFETLAGGGTVSDATATTKGIVQLAGDLAGTAASPTVPGLAGKAAALHTHVATTDLTATGTKDATTFLRGDNTWAAPTGVSAPDASETVKGIVELATAAETTTGTDAARAVHPAGLKVELDKKVPTTRAVTAGTGLSGGGDLSADRSLAVAYGSTAGTAAQGDDTRLSDARTPTDGSVTDAKVAAGAAISLSKLATDPLARANHTGTQTAATISDLTEIVQDLVAAMVVQGSNMTITYDDATGTLTFASSGGATGMATKNNTVALDGDTEQFAAFTVNDDATATSGWPNRLEFSFQTGGVTRHTGYFNEYGEGRFVPAKASTTGLRVFTKEFAADANHSAAVPVFDVMDDRTTRTIMLGIYPDGTLETLGDVRAANLPDRITVSSTAPSAPAVGDVWIDTAA